MKLVRLRKMCLTGTYSRVWADENLSVMFQIRNGLKQGDALSRILLNYALEYAIRRVQLIQNGWKLNSTHRILVYADYINIFGKSVHNIKENAEVLIEISKVIGLEVNADKSKYMVMSRDQHAGQSHSTKTDNSFFERVEEIKYLGTTLTNPVWSYWSPIGCPPRWWIAEGSPDIEGTGK
jgi:hypothetical protein